MNDLCKKLKSLLERVPDDAMISAYEGEDTGFAVHMPDGSFQFIRARSTRTEDDQPEFTL